MINSRRVKKCQYKYFNHVINFMQNIVKIDNRFLFLLIGIQIMILNFSFSHVKSNKTHCRFEKKFCVRRNFVEIRFKCLIKHYFDYKELSIDVDKLPQLFVNDAIFNQLTTHEKLNDSAAFHEKNLKISLNMLILRRQIKFWRNNVNIANFNKSIDHEKMSITADFCVSNVINHIIEKLHLKKI